jgi:hypothetical protein
MNPRPQIYRNSEDKFLPKAQNSGSFEPFFFLLFLFLDGLGCCPVLVRNYFPF